MRLQVGKYFVFRLKGKFEQASGNKKIVRVMYVLVMIIFSLLPVPFSLFNNILFSRTIACNHTSFFLMYWCVYLS